MNKTTAVKFVYFDLGGTVALDFSKTDKWQKMKLVMGVKQEFEEEFDKLFDKYELEELCLTRDVDSLIPIFSRKFSMKFPKNFSMLKYFVDHFEKNTSIWPVISEIHKTRGVGLLTNMYPQMFEAIRKRGLLPLVQWDAIIDSSIVGLQKPDPKIYKLAEEKCGFRGSEILFIDNTRKNIDSAKEFGWQTFLYDSESPPDSSCKLLSFWEKS